MPSAIFEHGLDCYDRRDALIATALGPYVKLAANVDVSWPELWQVAGARQSEFNNMLSCTWLADRIKFNLTTSFCIHCYTAADVFCDRAFGHVGERRTR